MPCFHPRTVWRSPKITNPSGSLKTLFRKPVHMFDDKTEFPVNLFDRSEGTITPFKFYSPEEFQIPGCKPMCVGCQEVYSRSWAVRCWHESQLHDANCFITLTFNDKFVPEEGLDHRWFQLFMKRLRKFLGAGHAKRVRYFMAGEYGKQFFRPHFHACLFGYDFPDRVMWTKRGDVQLDTSEILSNLWSDPKTGESIGFSSVGDVSFDSAAYIARYCAKKMRGDESEAYYRGRTPEYVRMSLKPGIAKNWIQNYVDSVYPEDAVALRGGGRCKPPRYYDKIFELTNPKMSGSVRKVRKERAASSPDNTPERLRTREIVKKAQFKQLTRSL